MKLQFTISGEYITEMSKELVLKGNWEGAIRVLSMDNEDKLELVYKILQGDMKLIGNDDNIQAVEDNDIEYKQEISEIYSGFCYIDEEWVKPCRTVNTITKKSILSDQRAIFYKENLKDKAQILEINGKPIMVLFQADEDGLIPPIWMQSKLKKSNQENLDNYLSAGMLIEEWGLTLDYVESMYELPKNEQNQRDFLDYLSNLNDSEDLISRSAFNEELYARESLYEKLVVDVCRNKIRSKETEWLEIEGLKIPKTPFMRWLHKILNFNEEEIYEWEPVSYSGFKMIGDNPFHTDWVIGAGLDPDTFYDSKEEKIVNNYIFSISRRPLIRINGKGQFTGIITHDINNVSKENILVIPHSGIEFFEASKKAGAVVAAVGGPAAHLVVNSREYNIKFALVLHADKTFKEGEKVTLFLDMGRFIHEDDRLNMED